MDKKRKRFVNDLVNILLETGCDITQPIGEYNRKMRLKYPGVTWLQVPATDVDAVNRILWRQRHKRLGASGNP